MYSLKHIRPFIIASMIITASFAPAPIALSQDAPETAFQNTDSSEDDGTYKVIIVGTAQACTTLCQAESDVCRGSISIQPDITKPDIECRLNNGFGSNPAFPRTPPEPLILDTALMDLNAYRAQKGLLPVKLNATLTAVSQSHADDRAAAGSIAHEGTDGSGSGDRLLAANYVYSITAENVASGQKSWEQVFKAWQDSPGHNANLLRDDVSEFGVAVTYNPKTSQSIYWVMLVAAPQQPHHIIDIQSFTDKDIE